MSAAGLFFGMIFGLIGAGYFMYGKKQQRYSILLSGALLCIFPYFINNLILLVIIGVLLLILPFFMDF
ncbi:MAG: hypothetical protein M0022_10745 [Desulfobacteraceae bacterium]|nr:hypothetical protein [Desulfobacteraceae bacterium]